MDLEHHYGCHNYHPIPVVLNRAKGKSHKYILPKVFMSGMLKEKDISITLLLIQLLIKGIAIQESSTR